jgi:hypothetical protein
MAIPWLFESGFIEFEPQPIVETLLRRFMHRHFLLFSPIF